MSCLLALSANAAALVNTGNSLVTVTTNTGKANVGECSPSTSSIDLDINNIRARLLGGGDFWWDGVGDAKYEYPKSDLTTGVTPKTVLFAGALWFTGYDDGNNLRCAAQTYRNQGHDFWPGPLKFGEDITVQECANFDHHFKVEGEDIKKFLAKVKANGGTIAEGDIPESIRYWPGKGNPLLQNHASYSKWYFNDGPLAPFFDADADGNYDPRQGDYPVIKVITDPNTGISSGFYADQMIFWVINDLGNIHARTTGKEIGVQVNCLAFAYQTSDEINDMTFYTYEIFKKSAGDLQNAYMGLFVDPDLGDYNDDYVGCDTVRNLGFCYNADNDDAVYGAGPPIVAIDYFEGPLADDGSELGLSSFCYFINSGPANLSDPAGAAQFRNLQEGKLTLGDPMYADGDGTPPGAPVTKYAFYGNPSNPAEWSEPQASPANTPGDRRFVQNSGPFTLTTAQPQRISVGVMVVATDPNSYDGKPDMEKLVGVADDKAQFLFDNNFAIVDGPDAPDLKIREMENKLAISLINKPSSNNYGEKYIVKAVGANSTFGHTDTIYQFEGYKVYQLLNDEVTAKDLDDQGKARLIFQADIKNDIAKVFNYEAVQTLPDGTILYKPVLQVDGENKGIKRSFEVTTNAFGGNLVNFKTYYFAVVAYAYNNYQQFDPSNANNYLAQKEQYLQGRNNYKIYSAVPHSLNSESGGTILNAKYGQGVPVKRYEGSGNGGKIIELSDETVNTIVSTHFADVLEYKPLGDPLGVKVTDPLAVQNVDFELRMHSDNDTTSLLSNASTWSLFVSKDGQIIDTIKSARDMSRPFEQVIENYGISLNVGNPQARMMNLRDSSDVYGVLSSTISFEDENKKWLEFVVDDSEGGYPSPSNWFRDGNYISEGYLGVSGVYNSAQYDELTGAVQQLFYDSLKVFRPMLASGFAPYCLTDNYYKFPKKETPNPPQSSNPPNPLHLDDDNEASPFSTYGPAFLWDKFEVAKDLVVKNPINTLNTLPSVDIVITKDKTKWSRCVVFETGEDAEYTVGNSRKGQIRNQTSIDKDGNEITGQIGFSYFPGYAINVETGERLNVAFGESSIRADNNGGDMMWNPTAKLYDKFSKIPKTKLKTPVWGGKHYIYVFNSRYDEGNTMHGILTDPANFNKPDLVAPTSPNISGGDIPDAMRALYESILYTSMPVLNSASTLGTYADGLVTNDVTMKIRVERPYNKFYTAETLAGNANDSLPRYQFSTKGLAPSVNVDSVAENALDAIRVVPNPYYAYSSYEVSANSNVVKITNLPDVCTISIYSMDGKLVRKYDRAVGTGGSTASSRQDLSLGQEKGVLNLNNSQDWNLKNHKDIPVASGAYLIYISAPGIGEKVVKSVVFVRPPDVTNF